MGVDFYGCDCCGESRYEEYVDYCSKCGHSLCTRCLVNKESDSIYAYDHGVRFDGTEIMAKEYGFDIEDYEVGDVIDDIGIDENYCPFCSGNRIHNDELLDFALSLLCKTKDDLKNEYISRK